MPVQLTGTVAELGEISRASDHFPAVLKALTDLAHEADRFVAKHPRDPDADALEFLIGRALHAIRKANTMQEGVPS